MKFGVKAWSKGGGGGGVNNARVGLLHIHQLELEVETPCLLLPTRKGLPFFISPDLLLSLPSPDSRLLHFSPLHFLDGPSPKTISTMGGLHKMLGLHPYAFVALPRDSIQCLPVCDGSNKLGPAFDTPCGRRLIKPAEYMEVISSMRPNICVALADEVPAWISRKRNTSSVDRTLQWLDHCIASCPTGVDIFGAIVGGTDLRERERCAKEVARRHLPGYWIGGFGLGESMDERSALLRAVCENLPEEKPRLICGLGLPEEVLQGVAAGVDLFDSTFIYHITVGGFALIFPLGNIVEDLSALRVRNIGNDRTKINLRATVYRKDTTPILESCDCYTCKNHTKAYINHLLNVHEMLAQILLEIHNTHHYLGFFRSIRDAIKEGKFAQFRQTFIDANRSSCVLSS